MQAILTGMGTTYGTLRERADRQLLDDPSVFPGARRYRSRRR
jgi:hypothetical protein